jgi:DNA-binding beta-propeller fold protein YncE
VRKFATISLLALCLLSCKHDAPVQPAQLVTDNFPGPVRNIFINRCATSGCHNAASYSGSGGLLLDSWEHLFDGGNSGAVVVPYDTDNSSLLYYINTYPELGTVAEPTMPQNNTPLTRDEYITIRNWIAKGAPDKNSNIPFAANPLTRQKIYATQQGCDFVAVIDAEKNVVMRYIKAGISTKTETPNCIKVSPDGMYAYVSFWNANIIQTIDTRTDSIIATLDMGEAYRKTIHLSPDGSKLLATNWQSQDLVLVNTTTMQVEKTYPGSHFDYPESITSNATFNRFLITARFGNTMYKLEENGSVQILSVDGQPPTTTHTATTPDPYRILMAKDYSKYFVTCENTDELRVMDANTDQLIKTIRVGNKPQEMAMSNMQPYLFITCNDTLAAPFVGSVLVVNYNTLEVVKKIEASFFQPYGITVDDRNGKFYVFNRNDDRNGPRPHHTSPCNGRNGYYMVFDINTLQQVSNRRYEISVDPYAAATRFK